MTEPRTLPHDPYIAAVTEALSFAKLTPAEYWTSDGETRGVYCYLNAVITLDPSKTYDLDDEDVPAGTLWRHGLILIWEWHTGLEDDGDPEKGPVWQFAELVDGHGQSRMPSVLPVDGYASPAAVVEAARMVIDRRVQAGPDGATRWDGGVIGDSWERRTELDAACEAWGVDEASE
jgi:hypothetical protein